MRKTLALMIIALLAAPFAVNAQDKGDTKIIIATGKTAQENYSMIGRYLLSMDYEIREKDDTFFTMDFEPVKVYYQEKNIGTWRYLILSARAEDNRLIITAEYKSSGARRKPLVFDSKKTDVTSLFNHVSELLDDLGEVSHSK